MPIVLYWNPEHSEIRKSDEEFFDSLVQAKILHYNPKQAANFINNNWENIDEWWSSKKVQKSVKLFCEVYAKTSEKTLYEWKKNLQNVVNNEII